MVIKSPQGKRNDTVAESFRMKQWQVILSKEAKKDAKKIASSGLKSQARALLEILPTL
jgi:hypothetical protein